MILPIWQPLFQSSHRLAQEIGSQRGEPATHTGTLDPLAAGVLVVLTGEDRWRKGQLPDWTKVYEFSILWGIQTDSGDLLGLVQAQTTSAPALEAIQSACQNFPREYQQRIPDFSARRWEGGSAFQAAKQQQKIPLKTRLVRLQSLDSLSAEEITVARLHQHHAASISQVSGEFRQAEVLHSWAETLSRLPPKAAFLITHHRAKTSPGTYIRQLTQDLAHTLNTPATTFSITRTHNGPYSQKDCQQ